MAKKTVSLLMLGLLLLGISSIALNVRLVNPLVLAASSNLNLPSTSVAIEASNGTDSYFSTYLSNIPSGYSVVNGLYNGWCVDTTAEMERSPSIHIVQLYSSASPPGELANERWDMVNYIINHKQGTRMDIQEAIWYFVNMADGYSVASDIAQTIINDAQVNGVGFVPVSDQKIAVICYPLLLFPESVQISIIEVSLPASGSIQPPSDNVETAPTGDDHPKTPTNNGAPVTPAENDVPATPPENDFQPSGENSVGSVSMRWILAVMGLIAASIVIALVLYVKNRTRKA